VLLMSCGLNELSAMVLRCAATRPKTGDRQSILASAHSVLDTPCGSKLPKGRCSISATTVPTSLRAVAATAVLARKPPGRAACVRSRHIVAERRTHGDGVAHVSQMASFKFARHGFDARHQALKHDGETCRQLRVCGVSPVVSATRWKCT